MYILRGTQKLLTGKHLTRETIATDPAPPTTTALGDWYAHRLIVDRQHLAICVSERSRLCVLTTARDLDNLPQRLYYTLVDLLRVLDVPEGALTEEAIARERREMQEMRFGPTTETSQGRSVLGTINDYSNALRYEGLEGRSLAEWNQHLSQWICGPLRNERPHTASARLLQEALAREPLALA
jgi:hypothetical protein